MQEVDIEKVKALAELHKRNNKSWHFHMLTPECKFNPGKKHAIVLEDTTDNETSICYSDSPHIEIGRELADLQCNVPSESEGEIVLRLSDQIKPILKRAEELSDKEFPWHYHLLSPDCVFNEDRGKWVIAFEDKENDKVTELKYDEKPVFDLAALELLFYQQKKAGQNQL